VVYFQRRRAVYVEINYGTQAGPVTHLRKMMLDELQRRHYSHRTAKTYVRIVHDFAQHFHCAPNQLGPKQIRQYPAHRFQVKKLTPATVSQYASALRFSGGGGGSRTI